MLESLILLGFVTSSSSSLFMTQRYEQPYQWSLFSQSLTLPEFPRLSSVMTPASLTLQMPAPLSFYTAIEEKTLKESVLPLSQKQTFCFQYTVSSQKAQVPVRYRSADGMTSIAFTLVPTTKQ